jgi:hypothetical protein
MDKSWEDQSHSPKKQVPDQFHKCLHFHHDDAERMVQAGSSALMLLETQ